MIIRIFKKGGIAMNVDSSENSEVSSRWLEDYVIHAPEEDFYLKHLQVKKTKRKRKNGSLTTMIMTKTTVPLILKKSVPQMMETKVNINWLETRNNASVFLYAYL